MTRKIVRTFWAGILAVCMFAGCDSKPSPLKGPDGKELEVLSVKYGDTEELNAVTQLEKARINYRYRLTVLQTYFEESGSADRFLWSSRELENLDEAQWFRWGGIPEIVPPSGESVANADPHLLVEYVIAARREYKSSLSKLQALYMKKNDTYRAAVVRQIGKRFDPVRTYMYFFSAELPRKDIRPLKVIPAADAIYDKAYKLYKDGQILPAVSNYKKQRQAIVLFLELVEKYPDSTKTPAASFYIGHIYREYFNENVRAVMWYQRAWELDPEIQLGARFQAAVVYDYRLKSYPKAYDLYKGVLEHERSIMTNRFFAKRRIKELESIFGEEAQEAQKDK